MGLGTGIGLYAGAEGGCATLTVRSSNLNGRPGGGEGRARPRCGDPRRTTQQARRLSYFRRRRRTWTKAGQESLKGASASWSFPRIGFEVLIFVMRQPSLDFLKRLV